MAQVLARCWARRWGRGQVTTCKTQWPGSHSLFARWLGYYFTFLMLQSGVASPAVISLTFQQGVSNSEINVPAIISAQDVRLDSEVRIVFDEDVVLQSSGQVTLFDGSNSTAFGLGSGAVVPADNSTHLVLNEGNSDSTFLTEFVGYYLTVDAGTVRSASSGLANTFFQYSFSTGDFTPPSLLSMLPAHGEPSVDPEDNINLTFSEAVEASPDSGKVITIQNLYTAASTTLICKSNSVVLESDSAMVDPAFFLPCQRYQVAYSSGCFRDLSASQNEVAALLAGSYIFETSCITGFSPANNAQEVALDGSFVINFSEAVEPGLGNLVLTPLGLAAYYRSIPIQDPTQVSFDSLNTSMTISPFDPLLASVVARTNLCPINAVTLDDCKGQIWDITMASGVLRRMVPTSLLAQQDLLEPLRPAGSDGETYRVRTQVADVTPPAMTVVSADGISETVIRVTLRLDESGTSFCRAFPDGNSGQKIAVTLAEIGSVYTASASFSSAFGYATMEVDVADLTAKTFYNVYCYAQDTEQPIVNVVTMRAAVATRQRVRTLDTTPPVTFNCTAQATPGREDAIDVNLTLDEAGTAFCVVVRAGLPRPSRFMVAAGDASATSFYAPYDAGMLIEMISADYGPSGRVALQRGTDYDVFCWAQDEEGNGQADSVQCGPDALPGVVRTLDLTPPVLTVIYAEAVAKDTLNLIVRVDEGSKIWCAAWLSEPANMATDFESLIKAESAKCSDNLGNGCGNFWIYDLDDVEDSTADGVSTPASFEGSPWKYQQDVSILLLNLQEATQYSYIYCFAEDDEDDGVGSAANKMLFSQVSAIQQAFGSITTLDETPPTFTTLEIQDPTASNNQIVVSFELNEPGTAYCRATRSDSGETAADMHVNRILAASWSSAYDGNGTRRITMTKLENVEPPLMNRFLVEATLYDVYCWAQDAAVDTRGFSRPNYMTQEYVAQDVVSSSSPSGGRTANVWVNDATPPTMILVDSESLDSGTIQVTLQLDEPGTIWCQIMSLDGPSASICDDSNLQDANDTTPCYYESFIKGSGDSVFRAEVPQALRDVRINLNRLLDSSEVASNPLVPQTTYQVLCFAEDDWQTQASGLSPQLRSPSFSAPSTPNKVALSAVHELRQLIGNKTTLDETPPTFTLLDITDPTETNDRIIVTFALNEPGTAYCRATRSDSGETSADMSILRILGAGWSAAQNGSSVPSTITMTKLENVDPAATNRQDVFFHEASQYDVYCMAQDDAKDDLGMSRPNLMSSSYVSTDVRDPNSPQGGRTAGIWVTDTTPPTMTLVRAMAIEQQTLQITLQLDEPGTVWCAATGTGSLGSVYCLDVEIQTASSAADCFYEEYIKGSSADGTSFSKDVPEAFQNVDVEITRIWRKDKTAGSPLETETSYQVFCFAEDDWKSQADGANMSAQYISPTGNRGTTFAAVQTFANSLGPITTLDEAAPTFILLEIQDPTDQEGVLVVNLALNEAGTAYCRATRSDSGETAEDMPLNRVLTANWAGEYDGSSNVTIVMNNLENVDPLATKRDDEVAPMSAGTQYDIYCWAKDSATTTFGYPRPNYMPASYVASPVLYPEYPVGGYTKGVWVRDSTPPSMFFSSFSALSEDSLLVQLQLSEPGTVWCAATMPSGGSSSYCRPSDLQDTNRAAACYYEDYIKGSSSQGTVFTKEIPMAYTGVNVEINRIALAGIGGAGTGSPLPAKTQFIVLCFAEDAWDLRSQQAFANGRGSPNFVAPGGPNKVTLAQVLEFVAAAQGLGEVASTLDLTAPSATSWSLHAPPDSESSLEVLFAVDEASTLYCLPLPTGAEAPHISTITAEGQSGNCSAPSFAAGDCSSLALSLTGLLRGVSYNVHCQLEDDNTYPLRPNRRLLPVLSATVNDFTAPQIRVVRSSGTEPGLIVVTLQLDEPGTVWCFSPSTVGQAISPGWVLAHGWRSETEVSEPNADVEVTVSRRGTTELQLISETAYETYCAARDTVTNPSCTDPGCPAVPNLNTLSEMQAVRDTVGQIVTRDVDPPSFSVLGARGIDETTISITLQLNEPGTAYCRSSRTDTGSPAMLISHIVQAGFFVANDATAPSVINIDKLAARPTEMLLTRGTAYDIYCWGKDSAQLHSCRPQGTSAICSFEDAPNYMEQSYVQTRFSQLVHPPDLETDANGGLIDMVRTWDVTPPVLTFIGAEARSEDSITAVLQLDEPGTAYCRAYDEDPGSNVTFADVAAAPGGPFSFDLPSDSPLRSFTASAQRNFEITVTGLSREVLYFVYCAAEDDEATDGCFQRNATESPDCSNNQALPLLTEQTGRYSLDLTPPTLAVLDAVSYTQDSVRVTASLDEAGTVWCAAVLDLEPTPNINEIVSAGFSASSVNAGVVDVTIQSLMRDTEYDVYCFARDDGTKSAANSTLEVKLSKKNSMTYAAMAATKRDAHVIYDSEAPLLVSVEPPHNAFGVGAGVNISLTFSEDIQAGNGTIELLALGEPSIALETAEVMIANTAVNILGSMHGGLVIGKTWRLVVPPGAIQDRAGNSFAGIPDGQYALQP